jgi:hypothetical protein
MRKIYLVANFILYALTTYSQNKVYLKYDSKVPQINYAARKIGESLLSHGYIITKENSLANHTVILNTDKLKPEAYSLDPSANNTIIIKGGDLRGLIYGAYALIEQIEHGKHIDNISPESGKPNQEFRAIKFNLPWETYRPSTAITQHIETVKDLKYWEAFLDMMVKNRFNVVSFWNMHPYTFMIKPKEYPEASPFTDVELATWKKFYHSLFGMAKERGLDTYIVHWSIFVSKAFSDAHGLKNKSYYPTYYCQGDTSALVKKYTKACVKQLLEEYPELDGIGISHGEGMAGMTPTERQQWMDDVIIAGMKEVKRPVKLIHRVPFSSGLGSEGGTSKKVEEVTREAMEKLGNTFDGPIWVEMKFNWSHGHSTPKLIKVHGGKLGDTYFDPKPTNYKVTWMIRNEDFFALRWGVPSFIRDHIAHNGQASYTGGYFIGSECYIPALDYFTATNEKVDWQYAFQRQWLFYKLWGRLLYEPKTPDSLFQADYDSKYGANGRNLLNALSLSSSTSLRLASAYDVRWDFSLYAEGMLALQGDTVKYLSAKHLMNHPSLDPQFISVSKYVDTKMHGGSFAVGDITPPMLADILERDNKAALDLVKNVKTSGNTSLTYEVADISAWAYLGLHLSEKIKAATAWYTYDKNKDPQVKNQLIAHLQKSLLHWDDLIAVTKPLYKEMRLTHYNHNFFYANDNNFFHWSKIRKEVVKELEVALSLP